VQASINPVKINTGVPQILSSYLTPITCQTEFFSVLLESLSAKKSKFHFSLHWHKIG
jgi:hypothetical protein